MKPFTSGDTILRDEYSGRGPNRSQKPNLLPRVKVFLQTSGQVVGVSLAFQHDY